MKASANNCGTPTKAKPNSSAGVLNQFKDGDFLFGAQTDRAKLLRRLEEKGCVAYTTIDQVNNALLNNNKLTASKINPRNTDFLVEYAGQFNQKKMGREDKIRSSCQIAVELVTAAPFDEGPQIHFILDDLRGFKNIHDSALEGFTSAELRTAFRSDGTNITWWNKGKKVSFTQARELTVGQHAIANKEDSPLKKQPRRCPKKRSLSICDDDSRADAGQAPLSPLRKAVDRRESPFIPHSSRKAQPKANENDSSMAASSAQKADASSPPTASATQDGSIFTSPRHQNKSTNPRKLFFL